MLFNGVESSLSGMIRIWRPEKRSHRNSFKPFNNHGARKQKKKVGDAFTEHQERFKEDEILKWRNALTQVANIKGWHLNNRHESEFIGDIVKKLSGKLCQTYPVVIDELIGIDSRSEDLEEKDFVTKVLNGCDFSPDIGIDVLVKKSLIKVDEHDQSLWMHDLLRDMGRKIVEEKSIDEPGQRCRLWEESDVNHVLTKNTVTEVVEAIIIDNKRESERLLNLSDAFLKMKKLRLLKVVGLSNCGKLNYLPNELRLLDWTGFPLRSLPSSFQPDNLVALLLSYSRIQQLWKGSRPLYKLNVVNLERSENLIHTPDFTAAPNLEFLILKGCTNLVDVHPSVGVLKRLKLLNLKDCKSLRSLPAKIGMESLETLILSGCSNLRKLPEIDGKMEYLLELDCEGTCIRELPSSIGNLSSLVLLNLKDCSNLVSLPSSIGGCTSLRTLDISGCKRAENLPENLQQVEFLEKLDLSETAITEPPSFIFQFKNLKVLCFSGCKAPSSKLRKSMPSLFKVTQRGRANPMALKLPSLLGLSSLTELKLSYCNLCEGDIPNDISCLSSLIWLDLSGNNFLSIPSSLAQLSKLKDLRLSNCRELKSLPGFHTNIKRVNINDCASLELVAYQVCNSMDWAFVSGINCFRLAENVDALTLLRNHLKICANPRKKFDIFLPGNEIPEWFSHQRVGSSIKIPLPLNIQNDSQWMGVAFCCIFVNNDASMEEDLICSVVIHRGHSGQAGSDGSSRFIDRSGYVFGKEWNQPIKEDHLSLRYWSCDRLYPSSLEDKCETQNCSNQECDELELSVSDFPENCVKVKKCGVRIVYKKDLEDIQLIKESSAEIEDMDQDSVSDRSITNVFEEEEDH
ncbi:DOMINANT SUPRESSOR OF camta3 NUMBER 1 [Hibiscus trionum]|uniref:DOMINANT SUPRESSOR OF camta3 NUMBER 1 n=1 Tax=Hibiscus trionum TaxID=183268 RepID=A0A9W7HL90_HIBTR|nr:DOMINANT SUPRESSOR OF camta3 NUMBER 1 [Hibiscus trionum]